MKKYSILLLCCLLCSCQKPSAEIGENESAPKNANTAVSNQVPMQVQQAEVQEETALDDLGQQTAENGLNPAEEYQQEQTYAVFQAISNNDTQTLKELLANGADLTREEYGKGTPLQYAAETERTEIVKLLAENGADVNITTENKKSPLYYAVINDNKEMAGILLSKGAKVGDILFTAIEYNYHCDLDMIKLLVNKGGKVNALKEEKKLTACGGDDCYKVIKYSALYAALQRQKNIQEEKKAIMEEIKEQSSMEEFSELDGEEQLVEYKQMEKEIKTVIAFLKSKGALSIYKDK